MMQYTQHNNEDDDAGNHDIDDHDQVDDAHDQFASVTTMWWPQTQTPDYDRGTIAP